MRELDADDIFTHGAVIPELIEGLDSDGDGVHDSLEREFGKDPFDPSSLVQAPAGNQTPADQVAVTTPADQAATTPDDQTPADAVAATTTPADPVAATNTTTTTPAAEPAAENPGAAQVAVAAVELPSVTATPEADTGFEWAAMASTPDAVGGDTPFIEPTDADTTWAEPESQPEPETTDFENTFMSRHRRQRRRRCHWRTAGRGGIASAPCPPRPPPSRAVSQTSWSSSAST